MKILNLHERAFKTNPESAGALIDGLAGKEDRLWPGANWPPMRFDSPLQPGASGGHGPIRYHVSEYVPGRRVEFRFDRKGMAAGLDGRHYFEIINRRDHLLLRHVVDAGCDFITWMKWHVMIGPMHDALLEDALDRAQTVLDKAPARSACWSPWVRLLRRLARKRSGQ